MDFIEIGQSIQAARKAAGISQSTLADQLGMSQATISKIESGIATEIGLRALMSVMDVVGVEIVVRPRRMGYTLEDAQEDLREQHNPKRMRP